MKTLNLLALCIFVLATAPALAKTSSNADFDGSGTVDFADFLQFVQAFGTTEALYDLDNSGTVDFADFLLFVQVFGSEAAPAPAPITTLTEVNARDIPADPDRKDVFTYYSLRDSAIVKAVQSHSQQQITTPFQQHLNRNTYRISPADYKGGPIPQNGIARV